MAEFDLIELIKQHGNTEVTGTVLGIGDDAAILKPNPNAQLVVSTDTLVVEVHFKHTDAAATIGHKALAVNLSDLAAMGAKPKWALLNLTLPEPNQQWLTDFIAGFSKLATKHQIQLVGGDTTQGPLNIAVTVIGETPQAIRRDGAQVGDCVVVTGEIGCAAFALHNPQQSEICEQQLKTPEPRLDIAPKISQIATAMIDISDGLLADLGHICEASQVSATIELNQIPTQTVVKQHTNWIQYVLAGGDDYQLCFTINSADQDKLPDDCHVIGHIESTQSHSTERIKVRHNHQIIATNFKGYEHFKDESN